TMQAPDPLREAYLAAHYRLHADPPFTLRIGQRSPALADLHIRHGVDRSAYLTACNPYSQVLDAAANAGRQAALLRILKRRHIDVIKGTGRDTKGQWPDEASFLALGLDRHAARRLGERFGQNAILV